MSTPVDIPSERDRNRKLQQELKKINHLTNKRELTTLNSNRGVTSSTPRTANIFKKNDFGKKSGTINLDLITYSLNQIFGEITGNAAITLSNIPDVLGLILDITIGFAPTASSTLTVGGQSVSLTGVSKADIVSLSVTSPDGGTTITVKKNDQVDTTSKPTVPINYRVTAISTNALNQAWSPPTTKDTASLKYEIKYSKFPTTNSDGSPSGSDVFTISNISGTTRTISSLVEHTTWYFWIKASDTNGSSSWVGPLQAYTEKPAVVDSQINFAVTPGSLSNALSWNLPPGVNTPKFIPVRINPDGTEIYLTPNKISSTSYADNKEIYPQTSYTYKLLIFDVTNTIIKSIIHSAITTLALPAPTFTLSKSGTTITAAIIFPAYVRQVVIEKAINSPFSQGLQTELIDRPLSSDISQPYSHSEVFENQNINTILYFRVKSVYREVSSAWSSTSNITTGQYLKPYGIRSGSTLEISYNNSSKKLSIELKFDDDYRGEWVEVKRTRYNSDGTTFPNNIREDVGVATGITRHGYIGDMEGREDRMEFEIPIVPPTSGYWRFIIQSFNHTGEDFTGPRSGSLQNFN